MTPRLLKLRADGYSERIQDLYQKDSLFTAYIIQSLSGEKIKPRELFQRVEEEPEIDEEQREKEFVEACAILGAEPYTEE